MAGMRDTEGAPERRQRRAAARWRIPAAVVLLLLVVGAAVAPWLLASPARLSRAVAGLLPELDGDVTFRAVRVGWTGPLVLEGIRVVPRDGTAAPLTVRRVEVTHGLAAILASLGDLGSVRVEGLEADVVFDDSRRSNLSGLVRPAAPHDGQPSGRPPKRSPVRMQVAIEDAVVRISGPWSPDPWRGDPIDIRATLAPATQGPWSEWFIEPVDLLVDARMEPAVAQGVLAYIAPVLAGTTRTSGRFSLRLDGARLPVGRPADGTLSGVLAMHEVVVGPGPLVDNLLARLPVPLPAPPELRLADESHVAFRLADRRVSHDGLEFGLPLAKAGQRLDVRSSGSVGIDEGDLDVRLRLPIPADLPEDRPVLAALAGKSVSIGIRGQLGDPQVVFDGSIAEAAGDFVGDLVDRLRAAHEAGEPAPGGAEAGDAAAVTVDVIAGIIEEVAKRRAEKRAAEQAQPGAAPPRRLRDRLRGGRGRDPAATP